ncbi:MAG: LD-carboxypeptidase [Lactobacillaceae bacterium]|jgi:muramoyltetrapeptide carboxypeptidase LdcA involved in peptidoglycan recycling|nr:LD-carboxypeptidase [Lactobacillaceae bacterium]
MSVFPKKIGKLAHVRVIAPSRSFKIISEETRKIANERFAELGIKVSYAKNADEMNEFASSSVKSKADDLHAAFADKSVDIILTAIGGYNSNEILNHLDYDLIKNNPKILCGFSDITALANAIYAKTGLVTYSGPHFSSFGMKKGFEYTLEYFKKCFFSEEAFLIEAAKEWSDDPWFMEQDNRTFIPNDGHWLINKGKENKAEGKIMGGNLCTINLLQGTDYMPNLEGSILFIEDDSMTIDVEFSRNLTSLLQEKSAKNIKAVVVGRFQKESNISKDRLSAILMSKEQIKDLPIIANVDFGHSTPIIAFPIGGTASIEFRDGRYEIKIIKH